MSEMDPEALLANTDFIRRLARGLVGEDLAEDVVQQTFLQALRRPPRQPGKLRAWLANVTRNAGRMVLRGEIRRRAHERSAARDATAPSAMEMVSRVELHRKVVDAVLELDEPYRLAVILRYFENLPPRVIARRTGTPVETVRVRLRRARERMRGLLDRSHGGDRRAWSAALAAFVLPESAVGAPAATTVLRVAGAHAGSKLAGCPMVHGSG